MGLRLSMVQFVQIVQIVQNVLNGLNGLDVLNPVRWQARPTIDTVSVFLVKTQQTRVSGAKLC
jgi:hypothetical protein